MRDGPRRSWAAEPSYDRVLELGEPSATFQPRTFVGSRRLTEQERLVAAQQRLHGELTLAKVQLAEAREEIGALEPQRAKKGTGVKPLSLGPRRAHHERTKRLGRGQARRASKRRELL